MDSSSEVTKVSVGERHEQTAGGGTKKILAGSYEGLG